MGFLVDLCSSNRVKVQKAALKLTKTLLLDSRAQERFQACNGNRKIMNILQAYLARSDSSIHLFSVATSAYSLLLQILKLTTEQKELPYLEQIKERSFKLNSDNPANEPRYFTAADTEMINVMRDYAAAVRDKIPNLEELESKHEWLKNLSRMCPELCLMFGTKPTTNSPKSSAKIRHLQPIKQSINDVINQEIIIDRVLLLRKSPSSYRKSVLDQTVQMFTETKDSVLVYDAMNEKVKEDALKSDPTILCFESRFESGNLQLAARTSSHSYDLILQSDINTQLGKHNQWFFFSISNMQPHVTYKLAIINMSKPASQFNNGMQPVAFFLSDPGWRRMGENVVYLKNNYTKGINSSVSDSKVESTYATLAFSLNFKTVNDTCFIAYHYPYPFSKLLKFIHGMQRSTYLQSTVLCESIGGNDVPLITITDFSAEENSLNPIAKRKYVFLSSRVHPGETNSSYIIQGVISFLTGESEEAKELRRKCIFKIVPMLNVDGVINGSHRCSLAGVDLNRQWKAPSLDYTPTIYWTKLLWKFLKTLKQEDPVISCDFHGHSRKKNVFLFGNDNCSIDFKKDTFAHFMAKETTMFDLGSCRFEMQRTKETTARIVLYRELEIENSYTLECSYSGFEYGDKKGTQIVISDELLLGEHFCTSLLKYLNHSKDITDPSPSTPKKMRKKKTKTKPKLERASSTALDQFNEDGASNDSSSSDENGASPKL